MRNVRQRSRWMLVLLSLLAVPAIAFAGPHGGRSGKVGHRPIEEFVQAQGTYCYRTAPDAACFLAEPPVGNVIGWAEFEDGYRRFVRVDFAGLVDRYLAANGLPVWGTRFKGSITERPLKDGRAEVTVVLHTRNAPAWLRYNPWNDANGDGLGTSNEVTAPSAWVWGPRAADLATGAEAALVDLEYTVVFVSPRMGAPMPDLLQFSFDPVYMDAPGDLKRLSTSIVAWGVGELRPDAGAVGLGTAGEPMALWVNQVGLFRLRERLAEDPAHVPPGPMWERFMKNGGWLVEQVELEPVGFGR
ncbi:MAG: hypothetical protein QM704_26240 [Anaeromyxobacteraceae bacterium]